MNLINKTIIFTIISEDPIIAKVMEETDNTLSVDYPLILLKDNQHLYMTPMLSFAKAGYVTINKNNIVGLADLDDNMVLYYEQMVALYKEKDSNMKIRVYQDPDQDEEVKYIPSSNNKTIH